MDSISKKNIHAWLVVILIGASTSKASVLTDRYPDLAAVPHVPLGNYPTPVHHVPQKTSGIQDLYIKNESSSQSPFGGNKIRKLEYVLADALKRKMKALITFGAIGSNHAAATAAIAQRLGMDCYLYLWPQPVSKLVRRNLTMLCAANATIHFEPETNGTKAANYIQKIQQQNPGRSYVIPVGASNALGTLGWVNAAFELAQQVERGELPQPDLIYVPLGSCGTVAGLSVGLKLLGWPTRIVGIRVGKNSSLERTKALAQKTTELMRRHHKKLPRVVNDNIQIKLNYFGEGYGLAQPSTQRAIKRAQKAYGLQCDNTYAGKAFHALIDDLPSLRDKKVLYWHTLCEDCDCTLPKNKKMTNLPYNLKRYLAEHHKGTK